jgi:hypothetical protein
MKTDWSNYTIAYDGINYRVNYRDNGDLVACENYVANSPTPKNPQPLISNLPAGTYKTQDWRGDWWEFTLTEDLCGIGDVRDSVEWDKYSNGGFLRGRIGVKVFDGTEPLDRTSATYLFQVSSPLDFQAGPSVWGDRNGYCTHYEFYNYFDPSTIPIVRVPNLANRVFFDLALGDYNNDIPTFRAFLADQYDAGTPVTVIYQLATHTRTPLIFTKNNDSTAPECPMEFLTDTPSLEYPAEVFDASGMVKARGKNLFNSNANYSSISPNVTINFDGSIDVEIDNTSGINVRYAEFRPYNTALLLQPNNVYTISIISIDFPDNTSPVGKVEVGSYGSTVCAIPSQDRFITPHVPKTFVAQNYDVEETTGNTIRIVFYVAAGYKLHTKYYIQVQHGDTATPYEPYRPEVTAPIPPLRSNADGTVYDEFEVRTGKLTRKIGRIESYNGEDVGDDWISSTGALDTGATVEYVLAEPIEEQYTPVILPTYYPTTVITTTNDTPAELGTTAVVKVEE